MDVVGSATWRFGMRRIAVALSVVVILGGCATIMQGTTQSVGVTSNPTGATVSRNGQTVGKTPVIVDLRRKDQHFIHVEMDGYQP